MSAETVVIVSDAHLRDDGGATDRAFHRFLDTVPSLGNHLVLNGDIFEFWFEYRSVVPRTAFTTLALLAEVRRQGVRITVTGGNHDRWGGTFWRRELGSDFHRRAVRLQMAGWRAHVHHGDDLVEQDRRSRWLHAVMRHPATEAAFRLIHPDVGFWLVRRCAPILSGRTADETVIREMAKAQQEYALEILHREPDLDLVVLGHSHRAALVEVGERRWYLNPGAWVDGQRYALVTAGGPSLEVFE